MGKGIKKEKRIDIELMRILAAFFVIFNHVGEGFFLFAEYDSNTLNFWLYLFLSIFCKFSVPLFFMISGALMLNSETESYAKLWSKKVLRMVIILVVWSAVYYLPQALKGKEDIGLQVFFRRLYTSYWQNAFWYIYAYIPFLISVPILQRIAKSLSNKEYVYIIVIVFVFTSLRPTVEYLLWQGQYSLYKQFNFDWMAAKIFFYPLIGYFLQHRIQDFWDGKKLTALWVINILFIMIGSYLTYYKAQITGELSEGTSQTFHNTFVLINSATVFVTCQFLIKHVKFGKIIDSIILSLGEATFGIYLMHKLIMKLFEKLNVLTRIYETLQINDMLSAILYCTIIFAVGYCLTIICKKIPLIKQLV